MDKKKLSDNSLKNLSAGMDLLAENSLIVKDAEIDSEICEGTACGEMWTRRDFDPNDDIEEPEYKCPWCGKKSCLVHGTIDQMQKGTDIYK